MPVIKVRENEPFDVALRRFKRSCEKAGILSEVRSREFYEKPTTIRKRAKASAVKRHAKKLSAKRTSYPPVLIKGSCRVAEGSTQDQQKLAMLAKDKARLGAIRLLMAEIKQREVDTRVELNDQDILAVVTKMVKQRRDSISQFEAAGRQDLADKESAEIVVLQEFLPQQLTAAEIAALIEQAIAESGAAVMADMGKVMAVLKPKIQGRADVGAVSAQVKTRLA